MVRPQLHNMDYETENNMQYVLVAKGDPDLGGTTLVTHNERLADPLDSIVRAIGNLSKKRSKTIADHEEIARLEWYGGLYTEEPIEFADGDILIPAGAVPTMPGLNILRCLQDGATRHKRGRDVLRGVHPLAEHVALQYEGPTDIELLWKDGGFSLRKSVGVQRAKTMRTRPMFHEWKVELPIEVDPVIFDIDTLAAVWVDAGRYAGLCEMRPVYGRFEATIEERKVRKVKR